MTDTSKEAIRLMPVRSEDIDALIAERDASTERAEKAEANFEECARESLNAKTTLGLYAERLAAEQARVAALEGALHFARDWCAKANAENGCDFLNESGWDDLSDVLSTLDAALHDPPAPADETEENMRRLGHAVMDALAIQTSDPESPLYEWAPAECPSEVIGDLVDMVETARGAPAVSQAAADLLAERRRQIEEEGRTREHDDKYTRGQLAKASICYALNGIGHPICPGSDDFDAFWPWDLEWWKPTDRRRDLVKAAALILAEIERLDRAAAGDEPMFKRELGDALSRASEGADVSAITRRELGEDEREV